MNKNLLNFTYVLTGLVVGAILFASSFAGAGDGVVNVYSARKEALILPLLEQFKHDTGIEYRLVTGKADVLLKRIEAEAEASPADIFITTDAGRLQRAKEAGVLQTVDSDVLNKAIPANLRDKDNQWFGLSRRARVIFYAKGRVDPKNLPTYQSLTDDQWRGKLCIRSSSNIYNQSLVASMIHHQGEQKTEGWVHGIVKNFARKPSGGDTDQLRAIAAGQCDIALGNTYYYGRLLNSKKPADREVAAKIGLVWPNQNGRGTHVNVSGMGMTRYAKNLKTVRKLMEYLVKPASQKWYSEVNNEYPVVSNSEISDTLRRWGDFKADGIDMTILGENNRAALKLMDRAGWR